MPFKHPYNMQHLTITRKISPIESYFRMLTCVSLFIQYIYYIFLFFGGWISPLGVHFLDSWSWSSHVEWSFCLRILGNGRGWGVHSVTDDTLTLQVEHFVRFEVTIATTTRQDWMPIMSISS